MYSLNHSKGTTKLLLESDRQDYGTTDNPTFVLNEVVQAPPFSFGLIGIEKIYWKQPPVFPYDYLNCTLTSLALTGIAISQTLTLTPANFIQNVTMNGTTVQTNLTDIFYDGSGGEYLARLLECLRLTLNTAFSTLLSNGGGTYTCDFSSTTFDSWNALSSTASTSTSLSKMDAATNWMRNNYSGLKLMLKNTSGSVMLVTFKDSNPQQGLVSRIFNISSGTLQLASTSGTYSAGVFLNYSGISLNFEGLRYIKCKCSVASGVRESHYVLPGVQPTSLLSLIPCTGTPGSWEYYEPFEDRVTVQDFTMDAITLQFFDYLERPLNALRQFAVLISIDFMSREEETPSVNVMRH